MLLFVLTLLALTRAEIIERMRSPVITRVSGMVKVYANCPEDMRREFQTPIAGFVANTVETLYRAEGMKPRIFREPAIVVHIGDVRTNLTAVVAKPSTNANSVVTRIYVKSPGYVNLDLFRLELVKAFYRSVKQEEIAPELAVERYRKADPKLRIADERSGLVKWLNGGKGDDEAHIAMMRKVFEPGHASELDVLIFASRLDLYPIGYDLPFAGRARSLTFREALRLLHKDPTIRLSAAMKLPDMAIFSAGRSEELRQAGIAYQKFLMALAKDEEDDEELAKLLDDADVALNLALEKARQR